jgi:hypothetical protein
MNKFVLETDTRLTAKEIEELGLEEASADIGPSLEETNQGGDANE